MDKRRFRRVEVPRRHAIGHVGKKTCLRSVYQAVIANRAQVRHHARRGADGAPPLGGFGWLGRHHGREGAANHVAVAIPGRRRAPIPRRTSRMRACEGGAGEPGLLPRGCALLDTLLKQAMGACLHNARAHKAAVLLGLTKPAQAGRLARKVCPRVLVSLLKGIERLNRPQHRKHLHALLASIIVRVKRPGLSPLPSREGVPTELRESLLWRPGATGRIPAAGAYETAAAAPTAAQQRRLPLPTPNKTYEEFVRVASSTPLAGRETC